MIDFVNYSRVLINFVSNYLIKIYIKYFSGAIIGSGSNFNGFPLFILRQGGKLIIGNSIKVSSTNFANPVGLPHPCIISVLGNGSIVKIGNNVGLSGVSINCRSKIEIGDNTIIGGGVGIWDTDFHPIHYALRDININGGETFPIIIGANVFIGARSIILKGVTIGANAMIAAGSVVTRNIPENEVWGGNPAHFIKKNILNSKND